MSMLIPMSTRIKGDEWKFCRITVLVIALLVIVIGSTLLSSRLDGYIAMEVTQNGRDGYFTAVSQTEKKKMPHVKWKPLPKGSRKQKPLPFLTLSTMKLPKFEESFRNPCWYERYKNKLYFRCFPYFYLVGFPKCGSTDLFSRIASHPLVIMGTTKETHYLARGFFTAPPRKCFSKFHCGSVYFASTFFNETAQLILKTNDTKFVNPSFAEIGKRNLPGTFQLEFIKAFPKESKAIWKQAQEFEKFPGVAFEASASTAWDHQYFRGIAENQGYDYPRNTTADWIRKIYPEAKIIMILRDPVTRAFSHYKMLLNIRAKRENWQRNVSSWRANPSDFHKQVKESINWMEQCLGSWRPGLLCTTYKYPIKLEPGLYYYHIKTWFEKFPRNQILILRFEDYIANVEKTLKTVFKFLGLPPISKKGLEFIGQMEIKNKASLQGDVLEETQALLTKFYKPFNEKLAKLVDDDSLLWQKK